MMMTAIDVLRHVVIELMANTLTHYSMHVYLAASRVFTAHRAQVLMSQRFESVT
jgi:hypothetical protein